MGSNISQDYTLIVFSITNKEISKVRGLNIVNSIIDEDNYESLLPQDPDDPAYISFDHIVNTSSYSITNTDLTDKRSFNYLIAFSSTENEVTGQLRPAFITLLPAKIQLGITRYLQIDYVVSADGVSVSSNIDLQPIYLKHSDETLEYTELEKAHPEFKEDLMIVDLEPLYNDMTSSSGRATVYDSLDKYNSYMHTSKIDIRVINPYLGGVKDSNLYGIPQTMSNQKLTFLQPYITKTPYIYFWLCEDAVAKGLRRYGINVPGDGLDSDSIADGTDTTKPLIKMGFNEIFGPYLYSYFMHTVVNQQTGDRTSKLVITVYGSNSNTSVDVYILDGQVESEVNPGQKETINIYNKSFIINKFLDRVYFVYDGRIVFLTPEKSYTDSNTDKFVYMPDEDTVVEYANVDLDSFPNNIDSLSSSEKRLLDRKGLPYASKVEKTIFTIAEGTTKEVVINYNIQKGLTGEGFETGKLNVLFAGEDEYFGLDKDDVTQKSSLVMFEFSDMGDILYSYHNRCFVNIFGQVVGKTDEDGNVIGFSDILNRIQFSQLSDVAVKRLQYLFELSVSQLILLTDAYAPDIAAGKCEIKLGQAAALVCCEDASGTKTLAYYPKEPRLSRNRVRIPFEGQDFSKDRWEINNHIIVQNTQAHDCINSVYYQLSESGQNNIVAFSRGLLVRHHVLADGSVKGAFTSFFLSESDPYPSGALDKI